MAEKTSEQLQKEKDAVAAMTGARDNMKAVLERVDTLEYAIRNTISELSKFKNIVPELYPHRAEKHYREMFVEILAKLNSKL